MCNVQRINILMVYYKFDTHFPIFVVNNEQRNKKRFRNSTIKDSLTTLHLSGLVLRKLNLFFVHFRKTFG